MATGNGPYLQFPDDRARRHEQIAKFSRHDAGAIERWDGRLGGLARVLGRPLDTIPPRLGSRRPREMEHEYGLIGGNIFHGELSLSQLFHLRPAAGYTDFRTPVSGPYQAGSATHGSGGVTGIPGLHAARQILHDRRARRVRRR